MPRPPSPLPSHSTNPDKLEPDPLLKAPLHTRWQVFNFKKDAPHPSSTVPSRFSISATRKKPLPTMDVIQNTHLLRTENGKRLRLNRKQKWFHKEQFEKLRTSPQCSEWSSRMQYYDTTKHSEVLREKLHFRNRMDPFLVTEDAEGSRLQRHEDGQHNEQQQLVYAEYEEFVPSQESLQQSVEVPQQSRKAKRKAEQDEKNRQEMEEVEAQYNDTYLTDPSLKERHNEAATFIQCAFKMRLARKAAAKMRKRKRERENNAKELLKTERIYVESLDVLREVYFLPLQEKLKEQKPLIPPDKFKLIFGHLETIHRVNKMFLDGCEKVLSNYTEDSLISSLFHGYTHLFKSYTAYCNNFDAASAAIKHLKANNQEFANWLKTRDKDTRTNRLGLQAYLILPIQRIPRYRLLLQDLIKNTDPEHKDYEGLKKSLEEIRSVANHLNSTMKKIEASVQLLNFQSQFQNLPDKFELQAPWRNFIKEGGFKTPDQQNIHVHLFNDIIIFSKKNRGQFSFKKKADLSHTKIYDFKLRLADNQEQPDQMEYRLKVKSVNFEQELLCSSEKEKYEWLNVIYDAIEKAGGFKLNVNVDTDNEKTAFLEALNNEKEEELDPEECLEEMKTKGATMLKYCRTGKPHFRHFVLSSDEKKVCWGSKKKRATDSKVLLSRVTDLKMGQTTDLFKKYLNPDVESESWSLLYGKGRSLDVVASDKHDFQVWVSGLRFLLQNGPRTEAEMAESSANYENNIMKTVERSKFEHKFQEIGDSYTWGQCIRGSLGHGNQEDQHIPLVMKDFLYLDVLSMHCGDCVAFGVMTNGALFSWGSGKYGRTGHEDENDRLKPTRVEAFRGKKVSSVAVGSSHALVLLDDGTVHTFGSGEYGQLGNGEFTQQSLAPSKLEGALENQKVSCIASGSMHSAAITNNGEMYVWGRGEDGQLGLGNKENQPSPTIVHVLHNESVISCALGMWHTMALTRDGRIYVWGDTTYGQCGLGKKAVQNKCQVVPVVISPDLLPRKVIAIAAGSSHSGAVADDGSVWMWGNGMYGQLGNGEKANSIEPLCVRDLQHEKVIEMTCGVNHTLVLTETNGVYAWGAGTYGRLGIHEEKDQQEPRLIEFLREKEVRQISAGGCMSMCVCAHQWVPDFDAKKCMNCNRDFTIIRRRHHCRYCGGLFCGNCSSKRVTLLRFGFDNRVRVCDTCFLILKRESNSQGTNL